jgi:hypothetical protein
MEYAESIRNPKDATKQCAERCWDAYYEKPPNIHPAPSVIKPPKPPKPLPKSNPRGCLRGGVFDDYRDLRDCLIDDIGKEGTVIIPIHWWDKPKKK